jgi:hypothetical protein
MAGLDPAILARTALAKDAIPVRDNCVGTARSSRAMMRLAHLQYVNI